MLDKSFIKEREEILLKQKERLKKELSNLASQENGNYKPKFPSHGDEPEENELEVSEYDENIDAEKNLDRMLKDTNEALKRIKEKKYGLCENCNKRIDPARLKAYPAATACYKCESKE